MKHLLLIWIFIVALKSTSAQFVPVIVNNIDSCEFSRTEFVEKSSGFFYAQSMAFVASYFKSTKDFIVLSDRERGWIIIKAIMNNDRSLEFGSCGVDLIHYQITIQFKDNKYKVICNNYYHEGLKCLDFYNDSGGNLARQRPENSILRRDKWHELRLLVSNEALKFMEQFSKSMKSEPILSDF